MNQIKVLSPHLQSNYSVSTSNDKFKATKLWNETVWCFFMAMPVQRHRRNLRSYHDCFVSSSAVSWLHQYLQAHPNFCDQKISRLQALNLLRKFVQSEIIERADNRKTDIELQDNKDLYRFTKRAKENLPFILDMTSDRNRHEFNSKENKVNVDVKMENKKVEDKAKSKDHKSKQAAVVNSIEKSEHWKSVLVMHLKSLVPQFEKLVEVEKINSVLVMHNFTRISKNGVVQLTDKSLDLPHWIVSAMKCLANWPKASGSGSCLPKYPGFELDVFNVIRDYFVNLGIPLISYNLYSLIIQIYDNQFVEQKFAGAKVLSPALSISKNQPKLNKDLVTSTPVYVNLSKFSDKNLPPNHVFETIFINDSPVTKIVSIDELENIFFCNQNQNFRRSNSSATHFNCNQKKVSPANIQIEESCPVQAIATLPRRGKKNEKNLKNEMRFNSLRKNKPTATATPENRKASCSDDDSFQFGYRNLGFAMHSPNEPGHYMMDKSVSFCGNGASPANSFSAHLSCRSQVNEQESVTTKLNKTLKALQLSLFLLPPADRRHLHLFLRLLNKIVRNKEIHLFQDDKIDVKEYMIQTFTRCILCAEKENEYDEIKSQNIVSLLLEKCNEIFQIPIEITEEVANYQENIKEKSIQSHSRNQDSMHFCNRITPEEFELQKDILSQHALADLLRSIMGNDKLSDKEKLKTLKEFKVHHPEVYDWYFTSQAPRKSQSFPTPKALQSQRLNILKRLLSVRF